VTGAGLVRCEIIDRLLGVGRYCLREGSATMKSINTKLILSALGIALLAATPAFAQSSHRQANQDTQVQRSNSNAQQSEYGADQGTYPGVY
jgi:hypothetical protein